MREGESKEGPAPEGEHVPDASSGHAEPPSGVPIADDTVAEPQRLAHVSEPPRYVVGVGASAGGFEALRELLGALDIEQLALVVVQHLSPDHESVLCELLSRSCSLDVVTATDGSELCAKRVYVIPPNADLAVVQGKLRV